MKFRVCFALTLAMGFMACTDYQSEWEDDNQAFAQGSTPQASALADSLKKMPESTVQVSGTYDCRMFKCALTDYLNPSLLASNAYGEILDARDNQVYKTIAIGDQVWMAQNMNYVSTDGNADDGVSSWCLSDNENNCLLYGRLYTWSAAMNMDAVANTAKVVAYDKAQGACPKGWRVPSYEDWAKLVKNVDAANGDEKIGNSLKSVTSWAGIDGLTDTFGFSAVAGGERSLDGNYAKEASIFESWINEQGDGGLASVWTISSDEASSSELSFDNNQVIKASGHYLRCIWGK